MFNEYLIYETMHSDNNPTILDQLIEYHDKIQWVWFDFYVALDAAKSSLSPQIRKALPPAMGQVGSSNKDDTDQDVSEKQK